MFVKRFVSALFLYFFAAGGTKRGGVEVEVVGEMVMRRGRGFLVIVLVMSSDWGGEAAAVPSGGGGCATSCEQGVGVVVVNNY
jgi:hypothetical protein